MAVVILTSASGAPGVTTTALGLALSWPRHVLLADCDRDASQAVQAGYLRGMDHGGRGLMSLAQVHRDGGLLAPELWRHTLPLVQHGAPQRRYLPGFTSAGASRLFEHVWGPLGEALAGLDERGVDVLVDAGRITHHGLPLGLLDAADAVLACVGSSLRSLAGARIHLATLDDQLRALPSPTPAALAVIGGSRPYPSREIAAQFGLPCWVEQSWEPRQAAVLSEGEPEPKRFHESAFMGRFRSDAKALSERLTHARELASSVAGGWP